MIPAINSKTMGVALLPQDLHRAAVIGGYVERVYERGWQRGKILAGKKPAGDQSSHRGRDENRPAPAGHDVPNVSKRQ